MTVGTVHADVTFPRGEPNGGPFDCAGEMASRCRNFDWTATPIGPVHTWSQSLRTTVGIVLNSRNPMFLWWGPELIQFYNDAYRPSLGHGDRHPLALGATGREFWTDIWDAIGPQIEQVMTTGEATWHEDQYLPIQRNGRLEDVWWTYGYSPVRDDDGSIGGTLVVCQETTHRVLATHERERLLEDTARAERRTTRVLDQISDEHLTMDAAFRIQTVNSAAERALGMSREALVGLSHWEAFPASVGSEAERQYRRAVDERIEVHFTHHYVGEGYDRHLEIDAYPSDEGGLALFWRDISERMRAEQALRDSESRLRGIYDGTYEYIGLLAPDGTLLEANRASLEFARNERKDVVGRAFWDTPWFTGTPGAPEAIRNAVARAAGGEFVRFESQLRRPSGELHTFDISLHPVLNESGDVVLIVPEGRDVTDHHRAEAALRASEARYRALFESLDEGFCVVEVLFDGDRACDYRYLEANPAFVRQSGLMDAIGRRARDITPALEAHWFEAYGQVAATGIPIRFEASAEPSNRWYDVYAFRVGAAEERRVAVLFKDVSAARSAARELERLVRALEVERSRLAYAFQKAPSFLAVLRGPDHVFDLVNEAYYHLVGHRELVGKKAVDSVPELREQGFEQLMDRVLATGEHFVGREIPILLARTEGAPPEERFIDLAYMPLVEGDETRAGIIAHGLDVTEQVVARREVERLLAESERARTEAETARADAETANRAKGEFLAVMSHELRTPLNAIGGYAELMQLGVRGPVSDEQRVDLARIQTSQRHLLGLINQVLNYARIETGAVLYELGEVIVSDALATAEALVVPQVRAKGLTYVMAGCDPTFRIRADREKLQQILLNVLTNAIKFTDVGGEIRVSCIATENAALISVTDTGIGIAPEKLPSIFEPFVQIDQRLTRPHEGVGLGLAISRDLAQGMGGDLVVESTPGAGSRFTLRLPAL